MKSGSIGRKQFAVTVDVARYAVRNVAARIALGEKSSVVSDRAVGRKNDSREESVVLFQCKYDSAVPNVDNARTSDDRLGFDRRVARRLRHRRDVARDGLNCLHRLDVSVDGSVSGSACGDVKSSKIHFSFRRRSCRSGSAGQDEEALRFARNVRSDRDREDGNARRGPDGSRRVDETERSDLDDEREGAEVRVRARVRTNIDGDGISNGNGLELEAVLVPEVDVERLRVKIRGNDFRVENLRVAKQLSG